MFAMSLAVTRVSAAGTRLAAEKVGIGTANYNGNTLKLQSRNLAVVIADVRDNGSAIDNVDFRACHETVTTAFVTVNTEREHDQRIVFLTPRPRLPIIPERYMAGPIN